MKEVLHFKSFEERMRYLKGGLEEIVPQKAKKQAKKSKNDDLGAENEKKSQNRASKSRKSTKKGEKTDEIPAE